MICIYAALYAARGDIHFMRHAVKVNWRFFCNIVVRPIRCIWSAALLRLGYYALSFVQLALLDLLRYHRQLDEIEYIFTRCVTQYIARRKVYTKYSGFIPLSLTKQ